MAKRIPCLLIAVGLALSLSAGAVLAQTQPVSPDPIASAPVATHADRTDDQIAAWLADDGRGVDSVADTKPLATAMPDRAIHGVVGASIGSGGYRSAYGVATAPLGDRGDVTVAVGDEQLGKENRGWDRGGGDRRSLGIAVNLNAAPSRAGAGCDDATPSKWSLALSEDAAVTNRCRRLAADASQR